MYFIFKVLLLREDNKVPKGQLNKHKESQCNRTNLSAKRNWLGSISINECPHNNPFERVQR